jgi:hypothetical protein
MKIIFWREMFDEHCFTERKLQLPKLQSLSGMKSAITIPERKVQLQFRKEKCNYNSGMKSSITIPEWKVQLQFRKEKCNYNSGMKSAITIPEW